MLDVRLQLCRDSFEVDLSCQVDSGVTALFGPSGAGKSSFLQLVAGLLRPRRGRLVLQGDVLVDVERRVFVPPHRRRVGLVFQDTRLFAHRSVRGNLHFAQRLAGDRPAVSREELIELLELAPLLGRMPQRLSGGEAQRVALARALLAAPRLLLLDEPLAALDGRLRSRILSFLHTLRERLNLPMIYVSHDLGELLQLGDRLLVLQAGRVDAQGSYRDLVLDGKCAELHKAMINVLRLKLTSHDDTGGMSALAAGDSSSPLLHAPLRASLAPGDRVSVALRPEDIALALGAVRDTSIQNQVPGRILRMSSRAGQVLLEIDVGVRLLAEVTRRTTDKLSLAPGKTVWCLIKSNAIRYL